MKRELAFALEARSQLTESLGRTRSSKYQQPSINRSGEIDSELNVSIDQIQETRVCISQCNVLYVYRRNKRFKTTRLESEPVIMEEPKGDLATPMSEDEDNTVAVVDDLPVEVLRRFTRSALKEKVEGFKDELALDAVSVFGTPMKNLELKMSKKIALKKRPTTVKELFETGLLEGYPVFYNGGKKGFALRGEIKGIGILCSCGLCKGSRVVTPCQFEIHACKSHRRASQYIFLENGKSLLQVMNACKKSSLETLEETIQGVIGPLLVKGFIICQKCMGSFLPTSAVNVGQLCDSCMDSIKSQANQTNTTGVQIRSTKPFVLSESSASVKERLSSQKLSQGKIKRKSSEQALLPTSSRSDSMRILQREKSQQKITKKSSRPVAFSKSSTSAKVSNLPQKKSRGNIKRKSSEPDLVPTSPRSASCKFPQEKSRSKITKKSSRSAFAPKSQGSVSACNTSQNKSQGMISKRLSKSVPIPRSPKSASKSRWKITKKDQQMHKLVFEEGGLPEGTEVAYYSRGQKLLEGYKKGSGIFCRCCNSEVSPSLFEAHAGWASRKKPYGYIYTSNGVSLHELAISLLKGRNCSAKDNDDLCIICGDGGNLLLCDGCPRAFHKECSSLSSIPRGRWYCNYCQNMFQREKFVEHNANAVAAGRVSGVDPIEQITKRCIRIVKNPEKAEVIACVLCRGYDFSKSGFRPHTVILCDQCEKEYHVGCLKKHKMADLKELPKGNWFCCMDCRRIYSALQNLLICGAGKLPDSLLDISRKKHKDKGLDTVTEFDVRWRLLSGKIASRETRLLLSEAVAIFHDCFDPIIDSASGRDFIPSMVYGRNIRGQDFGGMYCAILTVNSSVVSAGILRVYGLDIAEIPLVATSNGNQGKGYFQLLFSCIEKLLAFLNVRSLVLPAAIEAESIWTDKFGFKKMSPEQLSDYRKRCWQMVTFKGTSMLVKVVPKCQITRQDAAAFAVSME